ncbi:Rho termination factor N-terminal domain-containing protein [Salinicola sp. MH3R3-1]|uniref:Rho termination factor N-terminal domain-containing protein n=1 Tax=Salinicola sp. MH3R3-1 TaxID=1928762 RepID=UPI00143AE657|nr:Rho termination factor N-terminal domain-containing protein [Salinicola sp. MH3R3-1]
MQVLKRSLKRGRVEPEGKKTDEGKGGKAAAKTAGSKTSAKSGASAKAGTTAKSSKATKSAKAGKSDLSRLSREALYELAQQRKIEGRSGMNKVQLIEALGHRS